MARESPCYADAAHRRQAAEVHADSDGHLPRLRLKNDGFDLLAVAYVAGVQSEAVHAALQRFERELIVEVDVSDKRDIYLLPDFGERLGSFHIRDGAAYYLATGFFDFTNLPHGRGDIARVGLRHGLHAYRRVASYFDISYIDGLCYASLLHLLPSTSTLR